MANARVYTSGNVVNGRATISLGTGYVVPQASATGQMYHDDLSREQVIVCPATAFAGPSGTFFNEIGGRYINHGGISGMGPWEK